jgi:hypothetical protein
MASLSPVELPRMFIRRHGIGVLYRINQRFLW